MRIAEMNWMMVEEYLKRDDRCVLPLGSTEQHAYLSLSVDSILAERLATDENPGHRHLISLQRGQLTQSLFELSVGVRQFRKLRIVGHKLLLERFGIGKTHSFSPPCLI